MLAVYGLLMLAAYGLLVLAVFGLLMIAVPGLLMLAFHGPLMLATIQDCTMLSARTRLKQYNCSSLSHSLQKRVRPPFDGVYHVSSTCKSRLNTQTHAKTCKTC